MKRRRKSQRKEVAVTTPSCVRKEELEPAPDMTITHLINNPNTAILLAAETQEKVWRFIMPFLDKQCKQHGDFMVGGYRYSELKKEMADASRRIIRSSHRIRRIIEELEG